MASTPVFAVTPRVGAVSLDEARGATAITSGPTALTTTGSYTVPNNVTYLTAWAIGASLWGSGNTGAVAKKSLIVVPGRTLNVTVGAINASAASFTYRGAVIAEGGRVGGAPFINADSGAVGNTTSTITDHEGLGAALTAAGRTLNSFGGGSMLGAVIVQYSSAAVPLLVGASTGTRVEEIRLWSAWRNRSNLAGTAPTGTVEVWLHNATANLASLLHSWWFDGNSDSPIEPPLTVNNNQTTRWADLVVRFDSLLLPNTQWQLMVVDNRTYPVSARTPQFSVIATGADL
jgi:hypothetical protein